jgi:integrase
MARIYKRGRLWYVDYCLGRKRVRQSLGVTTKAAAEAARAAIELQLAQGKSPGAVLGFTLQEIAPSYFAFCESRNNAATLKDKRRYVARFAAFLGGKPLREVERADVEDYQTRRKNAGAGNALVNRELAYIKHFFSYALARGVVVANPCRGVKMLPEVKRTPRILSESELRRYFAWCRANDPLLYDLSVVAYNTGLRRGDLLKIRGADVNDDRYELAVSVSKRNGELALTLPLNEDALKVLSRRKAECGDGFLFPGKSGGHLTDFKGRFLRAVAATGIKFRFMEFRHNCATALLEAGADIFDVQQILGHSSITTTTRYLALVDERKRAAIERLGARRKG